MGGGGVSGGFLWGGGKGRRGGEGRTVSRPSEMVPMNLQMVDVGRDIFDRARGCIWWMCVWRMLRGGG